MTPDHLVSPDREIRIGGQAFTLSGTFATLKAIQHAFKQDILLVQGRILDMRLDEIVTLIAIAAARKEDEVGQHMLDEGDVTGMEYQMLKAELMAWLAVALAPKRDREKKARELAAMLDRLSRGSRGASTSSSASASSAGNRKHSGKPPSGK